MSDSRTTRWLEEGLRHHVLGDDEKAVASWRKILESDPSDQRARRLLEMVEDTKQLKRDGMDESSGEGLNPEAQEGEKEIESLLRTAEELFGLGDFSGSLEWVEKVLEIDPDHKVAREYLAQNRKTLTHFYESKLGSLSAKPRVLMRPDEILWLNIDHRFGFVLSQIDGSLTVDDIYMLSGMSRMETAKILADLLERGVIEIS